MKKLRTRYHGFGKLIHLAVVGAATLKGVEVTTTRGHLAKVISRSAHTIASYEQGWSKPETRDELDILIRELSSLTYLNDSWVGDVRAAFYDPEWQPPASFAPLSLHVPAFDLPPSPHPFVGRTKLLGQLAAATKLSAMHALILYGESGAGKTMLMRQLATLLSERSPDVGQCDAILWMNASYMPFTSLASELYRTVARLDYGTTSDYSQDNAYAILEKQRVIICIDNLPLHEHLTRAWFHVIPKPSCIIATCTAIAEEIKQFTSHSIPTIQVGELTGDDAQQLLKQRLSRDASAQMLADPNWTELLHMVGGNAKALDLIAGLFQEVGSLTPIVEDIRVGKGPVFEILFARSWQALQSSPDAKEVMLTAALFPNGVDKNTLSQIARIKGRRLAKAISRLQQLRLLDHLPEPAHSQRYRQHKRVRLFANQHIQRPLRERWVEYWIEYVTKILLREQPTESYWNTLIGSQDLTRLDQEWQNLRFLLRWLQDLSNERPSEASRVSEHLLRLILLLAHYFDHRGLYYERLTVASYLLAPYNQHSPSGKDAVFTREMTLILIDVLAWALTATGEYDRAEEALRRGAEWAQLLDSESREANELGVLVDTFLAQLYQARQKSLEQSEQHHNRLRHQADEQIQKVQHILERQYASIPPVVVYRAWRMLAEHALAVNDVQAARIYFGQARTAFDAYGGEAGVVLEMTLISGFAYLQDNQIDEAEEVFNEADAESGTIQYAWKLYGLAAIAWRRNDQVLATAFLQESATMVSLLALSYNLHNHITVLAQWLQAKHVEEVSLTFKVADDLLSDIYRNRGSRYIKSHVQLEEDL